MPVFLSAGGAVPLWTVSPFVGLLLAIAVLPLAAHHWWEKNANKAIVAALAALPIVGWALTAERGHAILQSVEEYAGFIIMLGSLFTISGGLFLEGDLRARPGVNTAILAIGAVIANLVGTTGASMLLIRPILRTNRQRKHVVHTVVFFIFIVCNTGGCLTPLGDPPLYLGFNRGVPFTWTFRLWPYWLAVNGALLAVYFLWDTIAARKESAAAWQRDEAQATPLKLLAPHNVVLLLGVVAAVAWAPHLWREGIMLALSALSLVTTRREVHTKNGFTWGPMVEVAVLFAGIFVAMVPALIYLEQNAARFGVADPMHFFWYTGMLSGFLDNAPTYLTFLSLAQGLGLTTADSIQLRDGSVPALHLTAISLGAVFMGANTYIGNGPNFMVKAIADGRSVKMPSFFGYMAFSAGILLPIFAVLSWVVFGR